ncbi:MAG TPA: hypothetical protein VGD17_13685 [Chitinophagaceae bacterium]
MQQETQNTEDKKTQAQPQPQPPKKSEWTEVTEKSLEDIKKESKEKWDQLPGNAKK